jgi:hypothetical protein
MPMTFTRRLLHEFDFRRVFQIAGVAFVGVDVDLELAGRVGPHEQIFEHYGART